MVVVCKMTMGLSGGWLFYNSKEKTQSITLRVCLFVAVQDRFTRKIQNEFTWGGRRKTDRMTCWTDGITGII